MISLQSFHSQFMSLRQNPVFGCGKMETLGFVILGLQLVSAITAGVFLIIDTNPNPRALSSTNSLNFLYLTIVTVTSVMNCVDAIFLMVGTKQVIVEF